jgi:hemerythrin superfamily protein
MQHMSVASAVSIRDRFTADHRRLENMIQHVIDVVASDDREEISELWDVFDAGLSAHLAAEEKHMFPLLMRRSERDAKALLEEHKLIRERLAQLDAAVDLHVLRLETVREFIDELQAHAAHEDALLYQLGDEVLPEAKRSSILELLSTST